ncbi:MAG: type II toxin-antitoxin system VapC family toxin [Deltaproteobacteria bacterium]|nr:type II toxin-antitoxin system VapC family toxin [Deltaproteobacteria bacterium]
MILDTNAISAIFGGDEDVSEILEATMRSWKQPFVIICL